MRNFRDDEYKHDQCLSTKTLLKQEMFNPDAVPSIFDDWKQQPAGSPERHKLDGDQGFEKH